MFRPIKSIFILTLSVGSVCATWRDDIGLTALEALVGAPDGSGIIVLQGEAGTSYLPQAAGAGVGNFLGKTFTNVSGSSSGTLSHATTVGNYFYGLSVGVAPGVTDIRNYSANDFIGAGFLNIVDEAELPVVDVAKVQNHSWIASFATTETANSLPRGTLGTDVIRRLDYAIERDGAIVCVGLNNGSGSAIPDILAPAYNVIGVGRTNGGHSRGTTPSFLDGPGRHAVDIVAPASVTSWATAIVSGAAALILDTTEGANAEPELIRAVMLAGATKNEFGSWSRTSTRPLDSIYGAGELNVLNNYTIITSGEQTASPSVEVAATGWDYNAAITSGSPVTYYFSVPAGFYAADVSVALAWNRTVTATNTNTSPNPNATPSFVFAPTLDDLSLKLSDSSSFTAGVVIDESLSTIENVEHIYQEILSSGQYAIEVSSDSTKDYSIAWRATILPNPDITVADFTVTEGVGNCELEVTLSAVSEAPTSIDYSTAPSSALAGVDFTAVSGTLTIPAGSLSGFISIPIINNSVVDTSRDFLVNLSNPINGELMDSQATVSIIDNDPEPELSFTNYVVDETESSVSVDFDLSAASTVDVVISYSMTDGTATAGLDYTAESSDLIIPSGSLQGTLLIPLLGDTIAESNEVFTLSVIQVQNASLATISSTTSATITIIDDDFETVLPESSLSFGRDAISGNYSIGWDSVIGRSYTVQTSLDLSGWDPLAGYIDLEASTSQEILDLGTFTDDERFFRILDVTND